MGKGLMAFSNTPTRHHSAGGIAETFDNCRITFLLIIVPFLYLASRPPALL